MNAHLALSCFPARVSYWHIYLWYKPQLTTRLSHQKELKDELVLINIMTCHGLSIRCEEDMSALLRVLAVCVRY